jgi:hypothetical protein
MTATALLSNVGLPYLAFLRKNSSTSMKVDIPTKIALSPSNRLDFFHFHSDGDLQITLRRHVFQVLEYKFGCRLLEKVVFLLFSAWSPELGSPFWV